MKDNTITFTFSNQQDADCMSMALSRSLNARPLVFKYNDDKHVYEVSVELQ